MNRTANNDSTLLSHMDVQIARCSVDVLVATRYEKETSLKKIHLGLELNALID